MMSDRSLLFLHGTFSNAASAYGSLANSNFFDRAKALYGDRIFAFNHFTVSRTPEENARMLLEGLPDQHTTFDVITHSRGGLVLRNLVERLLAMTEAGFDPCKIGVRNSLPDNPTEVHLDIRSSS